MVDFKQAMHKAAQDASELPSFPQKGQEYNIDVKKTRFEPLEDTYQEESFGRTRTRKQTLYRVITKEGVLRISPNQLQQLCEQLDKADINDKTEFVTVLTSEGDKPLKFELQSTDETKAKKT